MSATVHPYRRHKATGHKNAPERPGPTRARVIGRTAFSIAGVVFAISSSSAIAGLDEPLPVAVAQPVVTTTTTTQPPQAVSAEPSSLIAECDPFRLNSCDDLVPSAPPVDSDSPTACTLGTDHTPSGRLEIVAGSSDDSATPAALRLRVEVEEGLAVDDECFAAAVLSILTDPRGWTATDAVDFVRVDDDTYDFRLVLASPETTDSLCYPARTAGRYSCRNGKKVVINLMRWTSGTDDYTNNLTTYRHYLLNHEVGHFLGKGHLSCAGAGELAPVMMQQTKGLGECLPNGWPTEVER